MQGNNGENLSQELFNSLISLANNYAQDLGNEEVSQFDSYSILLTSKQAKERFHLQCMIHLAKLKTLNRTIHKTIDEERKQLETKKTELEKLQLNYENLVYKKNYLLREVHQCKDISTPHLQKIEEERGHSIGTLVYEANLFPELHEAALREISEEQEQRRAMEEEYQRQQQLYAEKMEELDRRRKFLEEFPKKVSAIRASTVDLGKEFSEHLRSAHTQALATSTSTIEHTAEESVEASKEIEVEGKMEVVEE